jgi:hypothetical protein
MSKAGKKYADEAERRAGQPVRFRASDGSEIGGEGEERTGKA